MDPSASAHLAADFRRVAPQSEAHAHRRAPPSQPTSIRAPPTASPYAGASSAAGLPSLRPQVATAQAGPSVSPHPPPTLPAEVIKPATVDDNQKITDIDLDTLDDKPWRRPGAHQSDFFNYGFDEFTWKAHCARQKDSRDANDKERDQPFSVRMRRSSSFDAHRSSLRCLRKRPGIRCRPRSRVN